MAKISVFKKKAINYISCFHDVIFDYYGDRFFERPLEEWTKEQRTLYNAMGILENKIKDAVIKKLEE